MMTEEYTLEDLEKISGTSIRTLRFYIQEGLLPGPDTRGKYARYSQSHLDTIQFIQRLKELHMPLKQIRHLLETMSSKDIERIIQSQVEQNDLFSSSHFTSQDENRKRKNRKTERSSALEYIRSLEDLQDSLKINENRIEYMAPAAPRQSPAPTRKVNISQPAESEETWQRIRLAEGVEIHVRQPMDNEKAQLLEDLVETAFQLFGKINKKGEN